MNNFFPNMVGKENIDDLLAQELEDAGIEIARYDFFKDGKNEVNTSVRGHLSYWHFRRAWYYWVAKGSGIPLQYAEPLYEKYGQEVRIAGHCGCPSPREWYKGFAVDLYHVDTKEGLKALADTIKQVMMDNDIIVNRKEEPINKTQQWVKDNANNYRGRWIAVHDGILLGDANTLKELRENIGINNLNPKTFVIKVLEENMS